MEFFRPVTWDDALTVRAEHPDAVPIMGGTDLMVGLNFGRTPPAALLDLTGLAELNDVRVADGLVHLGAGVTYARIVAELAERCPGLALASRTVGSAQIRNRATVVGNLGTASPAGDAHPPLLAGGATIEAASVRGTRLIDIDDFFLGVKRQALAADELIRSVRVPVAAGPQQFAKVGTRNAMVIAVCSLAVALDPAARTVGTGIGSAGPTPLRAGGAERLAAGALPWAAGGDLGDELVREFGELVAAAAAPIDDVRASAAYRRHSLRILAGRTLRWAWSSYMSSVDGVAA